MTQEKRGRGRPRLPVKPKAEPKKRGPQTGSTQAKAYQHVCPAPRCPRKGESFAGTADQVYCSPACGLRAYRARLRKEADHAD